MKKPNATRHPPGLKFLLTELVCHAAGGPELVTCEGFDPAKLGVPADRWDAFGALVAEAARATWPGDQVAADSVAALIQDLKVRAARPFSHRSLLLLLLLLYDDDES